MNNSKSNHGAARGTPARHRLYAGVFATLVAIGAITPVHAQRNDAPQTYNIQAGSLGDALNQLASQSKLQIIYSPELVKGKTAAGVRGEHTWRVALERLLSGTGLTWGIVNDTTVVIKRGSPEPRQPQPVIPSTPSEANNHEEATELEPIVVTGTHIRGLENATVPGFIFDRQDIDDSGYQSTQDFIRSLPQNFQGGAGGLDGHIVGEGNQTNLNNASGINLRGLGTNATLVLLNGHRIAVSGNGSIVDVSLIPIDAVERIDVVTDGSSAIYGADAVGGVVNFVMRDRYEGAESSVRYGGASGGLSEYVLAQSVGKEWSNGSVLASAQYRDRSNLETSERDFTENVPDPTDIIPSEQQLSGLFALRQDITKSLDFTADLLYSHKHLERLQNIPPRRRDSESDTSLTSLTAAIGYDAGDDWRLEASLLDSRMQLKYRQYFTPAMPGYVNGSLRVRNESHLVEAGLSADGSMLELPGGPLRVAIGGSFRNEKYDNVVVFQNSTRATERDVASGYVELYAPLLGGDVTLPLVQKFDVSAAVRYDDYSDFGRTTNPKIGVLWELADGLQIRSAYSTSFRAPDGSEQVSRVVGQFITSFNIAAPGGGVAPIFLLQGSEADLQPETAETITAGIDYEPSFVPGLRVGIGYYRVDFDDRIGTPAFNANALSNPAYAPLLTPLADDAAATAYLENEIASGATYSNANGVGAEGVRYVLNLRQQNVSSLLQKGYDVTVDHNFDVGDNAFDLRANASIIEYIRTTFSDTAREIDIVDTTGNPVDLRARVDLGWSRGPWRVNTALNYVDRYADTQIAPAGQVDSWTTWDINVQFEPPSWRGLTLSASVINLFDKEPPFVSSGAAVVGGVNYDGTNADARGRFVAVQLRKNW